MATRSRALELDHGDHQRRQQADQDDYLHKNPESGHTNSVTIGAAILIAALGAILRYAVSDSIEGLDLRTVGTILIVAGVVGLIAGLALELRDRDRVRERYTDDRRYPDDRRY